MPIRTRGDRASHAEDGIATGNLLASDTEAADAKWIKFGTHSGPVVDPASPSASPVIIDGQYGTLTIFANGNTSSAMCLHSSLERAAANGV